MKSKIRTFKIRDEAASEDEAALAAFLRTVETQRIETAYADKAWHILVLFEDLRQREETAQIQSAIAAALNQWRTQTARRLGIERETLLPDVALPEIGRYAPTTAVELGVIGNALGLDF